MGCLLGHFLARDATASWQIDPACRLHFDFDDSALNGACLGDPADRLCGLGPCEDRRQARLGNLHYTSRGLSIGVQRARLKCFELIWEDDSLRDGFRPYQGSCGFAGRSIDLGPRTREPEVVALFGHPYWRDQDEVEILLFYERGGEVEWQIELGLDGRLRRILVVSPPLLADPGQRAAYRVDKPFPGSPP